MKSLSREQINSRLSTANLELSGIFTRVKDKSEFKCSVGHVFVSKVNNILNKLRCPKCHDNKIRLTTSEINARLYERGIKIIGDYAGHKQKTKFICEQNHIWMATPANVLKKTGCPECFSHKNRLSITEIESKLKNSNLFISGPYYGTQKKMKFVCSNMHYFESIPANIIYRKTCPMCSKSGFKKNKMAYGYVLNFGNYIKYGITNTLNQRMQKLRLHNGEFMICGTIKFESGQRAIDWEINIKKKFGGNFMTKTECRDGYTETLSPCLLRELLKECVDVP